MTTDNAQPTVITAAEFVSGGYAQRVAAGECVVTNSSGLTIINVKLDALDDRIAAVSYVGGNFSYTDARNLLTVRWLPATDELASLRALVARYRSALERMKRHIASAEQIERKIYEWSPEIDLYETLTRIADAALAEMEEAK